ncbi:MAG: hypothetical protein GEU94_00900 [Micromonosporaceae bacterium]|nr:hypothetical protein [Micromonosporaceae bacterium]
MRPRMLLRGRDPLTVCQMVVDQGLHPEDVDVDTGLRILPLVLDDRNHFTLWIRLYSHIMGARNLYPSGNVERALWEISAALIAADDPPCFLDSIYLDELRLVLRSAEREMLAGANSVGHHGPYVALLVAENWCLMRLFRRQVSADGAAPELADIATGH